MITDLEIFNVIDSTKLDCYMSCPRQYLFRYILGWKPELPSIHLEFGIAIHKAMEHLLTHGYSAEQALAAFEVFDESFRNTYTSIMGDTHNKKNSANALYMLERYCHLYARDLEDFNVLHIEVAGVVALDIKADRKFYFRSDAICNGRMLDQEGYFCLEHKTGTTNNEQWARQWTQKTQMGAYNWTLNCLYPSEQVLGIVVNGMFPNSPPQLKKDGTPCANASDVTFRRLLVRKTENQLNDWLNNVNSWYESLMRDTDIALSVQDEPEVLPCFRKNTESCSEYYGCEYANYCYAWTNPLRRPEPQSGFIYEVWDPRKLVEEAKEKVAV